MMSSVSFEAESVRGHLHEADGAVHGMVLTQPEAIATRLCFWPSRQPFSLETAVEVLRWDGTRSF